jgi:hypothetical protein
MRTVPWGMPRGTPGTTRGAAAFAAVEDAQQLTMYGS